MFILLQKIINGTEFVEIVSHSFYVAKYNLIDYGWIIEDAFLTKLDVLLNINVKFWFVFDFFENPEI